jgi:hypothetical protein
MAESHIAAVAAITTGVITFIVDLMGHWWTRSLIRRACRITECG